MGKDTSSLLKQKKADSLMVSYVILIVITMSISIFVYAYLKLYLPKQARECEIDTKIAVTNATCFYSSGGDLALTIENRGLFNISGIFVKFDKPEAKVKKQLNPGLEFLRPSLAPEKNLRFNYNNLSRFNISIENVAYEIEIEPAILDKGFLVPCKNSIITYPVSCS